VSTVLPRTGAAESPRRGAQTWLLKAIRARIGLVALLVALAAVAWWSTAGRMDGMDAGPGTPLGALGWFLGVWIVMMAAMMLPAVAPTVALYERMARRRWSGASLLFAAGYLLVWGAAGLLAYGVFALGRSAFGDQLAWDAGGRWAAGSVLVLAAVYELTPLKHACLGRCRSPLGFLLGSWRDGRPGAIEMGARHGAWCLGCCWALMAALFALGVMSLTWMALVAALITAEKTLPWGRPLTYGVAAFLLLIGIAVVAAPDSVPGLTVPHGQMMSGAMGGAMH
jgi:predicted metal-binding membrane protein